MASKGHVRTKGGTISTWEKEPGGHLPLKMRTCVAIAEAMDLPSMTAWELVCADRVARLPDAERDFIHMEISKRAKRHRPDSETAVLEGLAEHLDRCDKLHPPASHRDNPTSLASSLSTCLQSPASAAALTDAIHSLSALPHHGQAVVAIAMRDLVTHMKRAMEHGADFERTIRGVSGESPVQNGWPWVHARNHPQHQD